MSQHAKLLQIITALAMVAIGAAIVLFALSFPPPARLIPSIVGVALAALSLLNAWQLWRIPIGAPEQPDAEGDLGGLALMTNRAPLTRFGVIMLATVLILPAVWLAGYPIATSLYLVACLIVLARTSWLTAIVLAAANFAVVYAFLQFAVGVPPLDGLLFPH